MVVQVAVIALFGILRHAVVTCVVAAVLLTTVPIHGIPVVTGFIPLDNAVAAVPSTQPLTGITTSISDIEIPVLAMLAVIALSIPAVRSQGAIGHATSIGPIEHLIVTLLELMDITVTTVRRQGAVRFAPSVGPIIFPVVTILLPVYLAITAEGAS